MLECTDTHACGEVFIYTSDRAVLVHMTLRVSRSCVAVLGAYAHSSFFLFHLFDDQLDLVQSCQPLQSCHWMLEICGSAGVLTSLSTKMSSMLQSLLFGESGYTIPAPPTGVCFPYYGLFQCSRYATVRERVLFLVRSQYGTIIFSLSSVTYSDRACTRCRSYSKVLSIKPALPYFLVLLRWSRAVLCTLASQVLNQMSE